MKATIFLSVCLSLGAGVLVGWFAATWLHGTGAGNDPRAGVAPGRPVPGVPRLPGSDAVVAAPVASEGGVDLYFSPEGGCTAAIVREIGVAQTSIHVQAAQLTSVPIAKALIAAHERGVEVRVVVDKDRAGDKKDGPQAERLANAGIPTFTDGRHNAAHDKVMVIDQKVVITGSFNFTKESEAKNAENLVILRDKPALVAAYEAHFQEHLAHAELVSGR